MLNIFIANRILQILDLTLVNNWSYVKSEFNPVDCASRALRSLEFLRHDSWFIDPSFIRTPEQHALSTFTPLRDYLYVIREIPDRRKTVVALAVQ